MVDWPHAPIHRFSPHGLFFVTASTYLKRHYYRSSSDLDRMQETLFRKAEEFECALESWSVLSNHYHIVTEGRGPALKEMLTELHRAEGFAVNQRDGVSGRQVWYQFYDTELTYERSWLARLRYTNENPVHHGLVRNATDYPWCSASWFEKNASRAFAKTVASFKTDRINVRDDFDPVAVEDV